MAWIEVDVRRCFELKWSVITCICIVSAMCEDVTQQRQGTGEGSSTSDLLLVDVQGTN